MLRKPRKTYQGFTMMELMVVFAIIGTLAAIAMPLMLQSLHRSQITRTISELKLIESALMDYYTTYDRFPAVLTDLGGRNLIDCWGNPYGYVPVDGTPKGMLRKDKFMVPVNTDFDLYSRGKDGLSQPPFTAKASRDDVVRANNGGYFGLVSQY